MRAQVAAMSSTGNLQADFEAWAGKRKNPISAEQATTAEAGFRKAASLCEGKTCVGSVKEGAAPVANIANYSKEAGEAGDPHNVAAHGPTHLGCIMTGKVEARGAPLPGCNIICQVIENCKTADFETYVSAHPAEIKQNLDTMRELLEQHGGGTARVWGEQARLQWESNLLDAGYVKHVLWKDHDFPDWLLWRPARETSFLLPLCASLLAARARDLLPAPLHAWAAPRRDPRTVAPSPNTSQAAALSDQSFTLPDTTLSPAGPAARPSPLGTC